jgi:integrase
LILTGCRRDEVHEATWPEVNLKEKTWLIPGQRTKNSNPHLIFLPHAAVAFLEKMPRIDGKGLLFTTNGRTPISGISAAKARISKAVDDELGEKAERWTLHDLRRTFVTGLQRLGFPLEVAGACVNHSGGAVSGTTAVYARHNYATEKARAFAAWAEHVEAVVSGKPAKVISMQGRGRK